MGELRPWTDREGRNEFYERTDFFARDDRFFAVLQKVLEQQDPGLLHALEKHHRLREECSQARPEIINSAICDEVSRTKHEFFHEVLALVVRKGWMRDYPDIAFADLKRSEWADRNQVMADNICEAVKTHRATQVLVTVGWEHRYAIKRLLADSCPEVRQLEYFEMGYAPGSGHAQRGGEPSADR